MSIDECLAELKDNCLLVGNSRIRRRYIWNQGHLISQRIEDLSTGRAWQLASHKPDCEFPGQADQPADGQLRLTQSPAMSAMREHLQVDCTYRLGQLEVRRTFRLYPDCPAIACEFYLRGKPSMDWQGLEVRLGELADNQSKAAGQAGQQAPVMERLRLAQRHLRMKCVQFFDATDRCNNLVSERTVLPYTQGARLTGNLLFIQDNLDPAGLFILKEAPCSDVQLAWPGADFVTSTDEIQVVGMGISPAELHPDEWIRCYGVTTGVASGDEYSLLSALRKYQSSLRAQRSGRDHGIMLNTWGDRSATARIGEAFCIDELNAGSRLGVTHFQIDDGWQIGKFYVAPGATAEPAVAGRLDPGYSSRQYWAINPARFPHGLGPVVEHARKVGIELCLWFAPSCADSYVHWREDADVLIDLHLQHGIRVFKIDGVDIPDKAADIRLRALLDRVVEASAGQVTFNLDVTACRRFGYHYLTQYGSRFLENRYTDWGNYYPHWTLRNLWQLSRYVPPQNLQIEFLNRWLNGDKYPANDPLAPGCVPFDYCFAVTMMAQPLAWFEASGLPQEAFELAPLVSRYRELQERIHAGLILPIGQEPDGVSWTGFQSIREDGGYLLVMREHNKSDSARLPLWNLAGKRICCQPVAGHGTGFEQVVEVDRLGDFPAA